MAPVLLVCDGTMERILLIVKCCECGRIRNGSEWEDETGADRGPVIYSHGYCPVCLEKAMRDIDGDRTADRLSRAG